jgi:hypothetical protein
MRLDADSGGGTVAGCCGSIVHACDTSVRGLGGIWSMEAGVGRGGEEGTRWYGGGECDVGGVVEKEGKTRSWGREGRKSESDQSENTIRSLHC